MSEELKQNRKKVGWFCTYTPEEIIHAAGFIPYRLLPNSGKGQNTVEDALPANICPYPRKILANLRNGAYDDLHGIVVANSCNAMAHLYNVLKEETGLFVHLLDVPRRQGQGAVEYFAGELALMADCLGEDKEPVTANRLKQSAALYREKGLLVKQAAEKGLEENGFSLGLYGLAEEAASSDPEEFTRELKRSLESSGNGHPEKAGGKKESSRAILLAGGLPPRGLVEMLKEHPDLTLYPENCAGMRYLEKPLPDSFSKQEPDREEIMAMIAHNYLEKPPCPRVFNREARELYYRRLIEEKQVEAVIYHDLLFCDMCHYDYLMLQDLLKEKEIPHLKVKTEMGDEDLGQLKTRVEAFLEILE